MTTTALATADTFTPDKIDLMARTICAGASRDEFALFLHACKRTGLDPFMRQIHAVFRNDKNRGRVMNIQTGIDGYRLIADRTDRYAGNDDPVFAGEAKAGQVKVPDRATVTVYKIVGGIRCPFTATARWAEYYPGDAMGFMWRKMPHVMLGKVSEALALRKAFPAELSGLYTREEMDQAGAAVDVHAADEAPPPPPADDVPTINVEHDAADVPDQTEAQKKEMRELLAKIPNAAALAKGICDTHGVKRLGEIGAEDAAKVLANLRNLAAGIQHAPEKKAG